MYLYTDALLFWEFSLPPGDEWHVCLESLASAGVPWPN